MTPETLIHHGPQPISHIDETLVATELLPCPTTYTLEPTTVPPIDYDTSLLITSTVSHGPLEDSASLIPIPSEADSQDREPSQAEGSVQHSAQSSSQYSTLVRCPCCDDPMTVGHMCDVEADTDNIQNSNVFSATSSLVQSSPPSLPPPLLTPPKAPDPSWSLPVEPQPSHPKPPTSPPSKPSKSPDPWEPFKAQYGQRYNPRYKSLADP